MPQSRDDADRLMERQHLGIRQCIHGIDEDMPCEECELEDSDESEFGDCAICGEPLNEDGECIECDEEEGNTEDDANL